MSGKFFQGLERFPKWIPGLVGRSAWLEFLVLDSEQDWSRGFAVNIDFGVISSAGKAVFVCDAQPPDIERAIGNTLAREITFYGSDLFAG